MKLSRIACSLLALGAFAMAAHAQAPRTRDQVRADLAEGVRSGDVQVPADATLKANEVPPRNSATPAAPAGKTREQVKAETLEAIRTGNILPAGEGGKLLNEQFPQRYGK